MRKLVHRKRWGDLEGGLVGDSHTRVWNYATDVGTCGALVRYVHGRDGRTACSAKAGEGTQARCLRRRRQERALNYSYFFVGLGGSGFVL